MDQDLNPDENSSQPVPQKINPLQEPTVPREEFSPEEEKSPKIPFIFVGLISLFILLSAAYLYTSLSGFKNLVPEKTQSPVAKKEEAPSNQFIHYTYVSKPEFDKAVSTTNLIKSEDYQLKNPLPSAAELINKTKAGSAQSSGFLSVKRALAADKAILPIYQAFRQELTLEDAKNLAKNFGFSDNPKREGFDPPAYYGFVWDSEKEHLLVSGGSGTGGFDYYLKGPGLEGKAPSDEEAIAKAKEFLSARGIKVGNDAIINVLPNIMDRSKISGLQEDHKEVFFRQKIDKFPVFEWEGTQSSPKTDRLEVWVGVNGRIISAGNNSYWTNIDLSTRKDFILKEPQAVFEEIKNGQGKLAWMTTEGIESWGLEPVPGNFAVHGKLKNVVIDDVELVYFHERKGIEENEFYQPIYLFRGTALNDWQDNYQPQGEAEEFSRGKKSRITLLAPAVLDGYFFENPVIIDPVIKTATPSTPPPGYRPSVILPVPTTNSATTSSSGQSFILKLGVVTPREDPKRDVYLGWAPVPGTVKYNVYLKISGDKEYNQAAIAGTGSLSHVLSVNKYLDYYFKVKACKTADSCLESNEVFLPQTQKPHFYLKLGVITPKDDPKTEVYLAWAEVPGTVKYNVFLKNSPPEEYGTALTGTVDLNYTASVNRHNDNYFLVQACSSAENCLSSNEIFVPKQ